MEKIMEMLTGQPLEFLIELYNATDGDMEKQMSMHEIGALLGLEKNIAGALGEDLIMAEFVELKTLAGGVSITSKGLELLREVGIAGPDSSVKYNLSGESVLTDDDRAVIGELLIEIKNGLGRVNSDYGKLEECVVDIKTVEVQLLSPRPKDAIIRAILVSLASKMDNLGLGEISTTIKGLSA